MARKLRYNDEEGGMVKAQLQKIEMYAAKLNDMIHPDDEIEGWVQAKLAVVAAYMGDVKHYLDYELKENFADGGGIKMNERYWEVEFTWDGAREEESREVNVMADSVSDAEKKVKEKFSPYYKGIKIIEIEEDKEVSWDEYAEKRKSGKMADGGMTEKGIDAHATAVGRFLLIANEYTKKFKIGGNQKLQNIVGENLFYKKGNDWWWNSHKIIGMTIPELKNLTKKIENSFEEYADNEKSIIDKMADGGEVMVELKRRGFTNSEAERLVKKHDYLVDVADTANEAADDIEKYDDGDYDDFPDVPQLKFSKGGKIITLDDLPQYEDLFYIGYLYDTDTDGWVSKFDAQEILDELNSYSEKFDDGGVLKKNVFLRPVFVELKKPSDINLNKVRRQIEDYANQGYRSADIFLKMAFVTDEPKLLTDQFQRIKNGVYYLKDVKKYYRGGKMEDEFMKYEGSSFYEDYNEAKDYLGEAMWNDMSYEDKVEATKYLKATGKIGWFGEYEDLETVASTMYKRGGSVGKFLVVIKNKKTDVIQKVLVDSLSEIDRRQNEVISVKKVG